MGVLEPGAHQESEGDLEGLGVANAAKLLVLLVSCFKFISLTSLWC